MDRLEQSFQLAENTKYRNQIFKTEKLGNSNFHGKKSLLYESVERIRAASQKPGKL